MNTFNAHFDGKVIILDEPANLPVNQPLRIRIESTPALAPAHSITGEEIARSELFGLWKDRTDIGDSLEFARELRRRAEIRGGGG